MSTDYAAEIVSINDASEVIKWAAIPGTVITKKEEQKAERILFKAQQQDFYSAEGRAYRAKQSFMRQAAKKHNSDNSEETGEA